MPGSSQFRREGARNWRAVLGSFSGINPFEEALSRARRGLAHLCVDRCKGTVRGPGTHREQGASTAKVHGPLSRTLLASGRQ